MRPAYAVSFLLFSYSVSGSDFRSPRLQTGAVPAVSPEDVGGGQVLLEIKLSASGAVHSVATLRDTPPFTSRVLQTVQSWRFRPAEQLEEGDRWTPVESRVLVAAVFRAPVLQGPALGSAPRDVGQPSEQIPFPTTLVEPPYPPRAVLDGVVLVEAEVGEDGKVGESKIVRSAAGLDEVSLETARNWSFRPARPGGSPQAAFAYLLFGFRRPVTPPPR
jgi:TonB family protein